MITLYLVVINGVYYVFSGQKSRISCMGLTITRDLEQDSSRYSPTLILSRVK